MKPEHIKLLARQIYTVDQPYWGDFDKQEASVQTFYFDKAQDMIELLNSAGFELVIKNDNADRSGDTSDQIKKNKG